MKAYEIIFIILFLIWVFAVPYFKRFKTYQFIMLIIIPFITSYLLFNSYQLHHSIKNVLIMSLFFIGGLIYQAVNFYKKYLNNSIN